MALPNSSTPLLPRGSTFVTPSLLWKAGAILATTGMIAGAFGSHALKRRPGITPEGLSAWGSASHYAIFNGLALFVLSMHPRFSTHKFAGPAIAGGGFVFSGSIIALVLWKLKFLGPITPLGGIFMIAGYITLAL
ncbi:hypothetical protein DFJ58DRAFT_768490 [Suillus subalutaceus]|uniref:uncharacterized protein n=1 Tax=Suillus subalutaceus TaxID=48586 RepID=UPI001B85E887|nr:uncharacterized protein DFJ58DRAFT_768490 [Suillus subalutaceus]KAG1867952.1 hypothetical protein DFJ58DRAFT_768490 [Suillus subalutaceus]KAG1885802.1 hypothetical protein F4604DRAFT_124851 [Suillus subluteus]